MATLNPQIPLEARQTVLDQVVAGASFTAYEITLEVRRRLGASVEVPHSVVNSIVQTMFSNGEMAGYDRAQDTTVRAATPPFRYAPRGAQAVAANVPVVSRVNRANLPVNLHYANPLAAIAREYGLEARAFHDAAGVGETAFEVWLPTAQEPRFRVRSYGAGLSESDVETRYALSPNSQSDFGSKAAYSYAEEFRVTTFASGKAKTFRAALDFNLVGTVTKDGEVATKKPDGVEIEVPIKPNDVARFVDEATRIFSYFRVQPHIHNFSQAVSAQMPPLFEGNDWKVASTGPFLAVVGDVALAINATLPLAGTFSRLATPIGVELRFGAGELEISENGEVLVYSDKTRSALGAAFGRIEREIAPLIENFIGSASNIWDAKARYAQLSNSLKDFLGRLQQKQRRGFEWNGVGIENSRFGSVDANATTILLVSRPSMGTRLKTQRVSAIDAQADTVVLFNDLGTRTGSPSRMQEYFASHADVKRAYVLTFVSDAVKARFIADNHFETVPTGLLSVLPKSATGMVHGTRTLNRIPFDASRHSVQNPRNALAAAFPQLNDTGFVNLEQWVRDSRFDGKQWPDFKRLYKKAEARVWPIQNRFRWSKSEFDLPANSQLPDEREAFLLGVMIGHLDSAGARRDEDRRFPNGGPTAKTIAYLTRRAARLLCFLRDEGSLSEERRTLLAPLVAGSMVRPYCADIKNTLAFRLGMSEDELAGRPDLVQRVWNDVQLALPILKWAFEWLRAHGQRIEGTQRHVRRFIQEGDADVVLALLPALLESGARWTDGYSLSELSRDLQTSAFEARRGQALRLFARFPLLKAREQWIWSALNTPEADEAEVVRFVTPLVEARAQKDDLEVVAQLSPALRTVFLNALIAARPQGLSFGQWRTIARYHLRGTPTQQNLLELLFPALHQMVLSPIIAQVLWEEDALREKWLQLGGEEQWVQAFGATIRDKARAEDFGFASQLPPMGRNVFFQELLATQGDSMWARLGELDTDTLALFAPSVASAPLSDGFWKFVSRLDAQGSAHWLDAVGRERAGAAFSQLPATIIHSLLESGNVNLESLVGAWFLSNAAQLSGDEPLLILAATNLSEAVRAPALARLGQIPLNLRLALRLVESGLPEAQNLWRPYFEGEGDEWAMRVLALADSPVAATRAYALDLLARFPSRWTPALLQSLSQHDDTQVQAFVAARLQHAPEVASAEAIAVFDSAIINSRGRARRAKMGVQRRLETREAEENTQLEALLDAARNGAPRDRAWALQQLVRLRLNGADIPELQLSGAFARAAS